MIRCGRGKNAHAPTLNRATLPRSSCSQDARCALANTQHNANWVAGGGWACGGDVALICKGIRLTARPCTIERRCIRANTVIWTGQGECDRPYEVRCCMHAGQRWPELCRWAEELHECGCGGQWRAWKQSRKILCFGMNQGNQFDSGVLVRVPRAGERGLGL